MLCGLWKGWHAFMWAWKDTDELLLLEYSRLQDPTAWGCFVKKKKKIESYIPMSKYENAYKDLCQNFNRRYAWVVGFGDISLLYAYLHFITFYNKQVSPRLTNWGRRFGGGGGVEPVPWVCPGPPHWPWPEWWRPSGLVPGVPCSQCPAPGRTQRPHQPGSSLRWSWWWWLSAEGLQGHPEDPLTPSPTPATPRTSQKNRGQRRKKSIRDVTEGLPTKVLIATSLIS